MNSFYSFIVLWHSVVNIYELWKPLTYRDHAHWYHSWLIPQLTVWVMLAGVLYKLQVCCNFVKDSSVWSANCSFLHFSGGENNTTLQNNLQKHTLYIYHYNRIINCRQFPFLNHQTFLHLSSLKNICITTKYFIGIATNEYFWSLYLYKAFT